MTSLSVTKSRALYSSVTRCHVCGFSEVRTDEVTELDLLLSECPRCDHRWTGRIPAALRLVQVRPFGIAGPPAAPSIMAMAGTTIAEAPSTMAMAGTTIAEAPAVA